MHAYALPNTTHDAVQTLEEMDVAFGDNATERERQHMEGICRELGLPVKALLAA